MPARETQAQPNAGRRSPAGRSNAPSAPALARAIGNARMARLAKAGPPTGPLRGTSPQTALVMRAASLSPSSKVRLGRCGAGCTCKSCAGEELDEERSKPA
jgi:hypothetical protein